MASGGPKTLIERRALEIAFSALDLPTLSRLRWAMDQCADDDVLAAEVKALLDADLSDEPRLDPSLQVDEVTDTRTGSRIGRYRIIERIGSGGMGAVYRAEVVEGVARQPVALKLIKRGMDSEEILRRFMLERDILGRLEHPNIARLLDGGIAEDGTPWFAMELVQGEPLHRNADKSKLSLSRRIELFLQICDAIEYAHRNLVIHRDLKPGNVLVTADGVVKLLDFGIAKLVDAGGSVDIPTQGVMMTPEYSAPEQFSRGYVTTQTDVYQLGILLSELLSGKRPSRLEPERNGGQISDRLFSQFASSSAEQDPVLMAYAEARDSSVRGLARALRGDLDRIVRRATHADQALRYPSAAALAEDLQRYLQGRPVQAMGDSVLYHLSKFLQRYRWMVAGVLAIFLSASIGWISTAREAERLRVALAQSATMQTLLEDVFLGADPWAAKGVDTLASDLLIATEEKLNSQALPPALTANLWFKIGGVHVSLRETKSAIHAFRQSIDAAGRAIRCNGMTCIGVNVGLLEMQISSARARILHYRLQEVPNDEVAMQQLESVIDELRLHGHLAESDLASALTMWIHARVTLGQLDGVKAAADELVLVAERGINVETDEGIRIRAFHASTMRELGLNDEALKSAELAFKRQQASGRNSPIAARFYVYQQLGAALAANAQYERAAHILDDAIHNVQGDHAAYQAMRQGIFWELIDIQMHLGNYSEAAGNARKFLATDLPSTYARAAGRNKLGMALLALRNLDEASIELEAAHATFCEEPQSSGPCLVASLSLVELKLAKGKHAEASKELDTIRPFVAGEAGRAAMRFHLLEARTLLAIGSIDAATAALDESRNAGKEIADNQDKNYWNQLAIEIANAKLNKGD